MCARVCVSTSSATDTANLRTRSHMFQTVADHVNRLEAAYAFQSPTEPDRLKYLLPSHACKSELALFPHTPCLRAKIACRNTLLQFMQTHSSPDPEFQTERPFPNQQLRPHLAGEPRRGFTKLREAIDASCGGSGLAVCDVDFTVHKIAACPS